MIDWAASNTHNKSISVSSIFTFSNTPPSGQSQTIIVAITNTSGVVVNATFPAGIRWPNAVAITTVAASRTNIYTFISIGGNIYATAVENLG